MKLSNKKYVMCCVKAIKKAYTIKTKNRGCNVLLQGRGTSVNIDSLEHFFQIVKAIKTKEV